MPLPNAILPRGPSQLALRNAFVTVAPSEDLAALMAQAAAFIRLNQRGNARRESIFARIGFGPRVARNLNRPGQRIERRHLSAFEIDGLIEFVAQAQIERQFRRHLPIVLREKAVRIVNLIGARIRPRKHEARNAGRIAGQQIGQAKAAREACAELPAESERPAQRAVQRLIDCESPAIPRSKCICQSAIESAGNRRARP